ncbi:MAG: GTP-binding protein, partial [Nitrospirales bacterium]
MGSAHEAARNLAFISYTGAGKTSLVEALLYTAGVIPSMGAVTSGNTTCDFEPEEMQRQFSISSAVAHFSWKGTTFNVVDTPGGLNFLNEAQMGLQAVDGVILVLSASMGLRSELEKMWQPISALELPCLIFVNELDKERAAVSPVVGECERALGIHTVPVTIPIGSEAQLQGVADLVRQRALRSGPDSPKVHEDDLPVDLASAVAAARKKLVEGVAETDDALVEKYLADGELPEEDVRRGLRAGSLSRT